MNEEKKLLKLYSKMDDQYIEIIDKILNHEEFKKRLFYHHHEDRSVYTHSLMVSLYSYKIAKFFKLDYKSAAVGGLLHDFYYKDWQVNMEKKSIFKMHGFIHAKEALENSNIFFKEYMNEKVSNIILRHMFPLNILPPKYIEGWIITFVDKCVSLEIFKKPQNLYKYVGLALIFNFIKIKIRIK